MRTFYHIYPTCPACHEPHIRGVPLERVDDKFLRCPSCGAYFRRNIDLLSARDLFSTTISTILEREGEGAEKFLSNLLIPWNVEPNCLEMEYIRWITDVEGGKFLVTWPWKSVKFIPLLVSEYLLANPEKRAVVIGDILGDEFEDGIIAPGIKAAFDSIICVESPELNCIDSVMNHEMNRFDKKFVLEKKKVVRQTIRRIGTGYRDERICEHSLVKCKNSLTKEINSDFGTDAIRKVEKKKMNGESSEEICNPHGFIDLKLEEREEWTGELRYNKRWLWTVLLNSGKIKRLGTCLQYQALKSSEEIDGDKRLLFIPSDIDSGVIFNEILPKVDYDLLIIQDTDAFMKDKIYGGDNSQNFLRFLEKTGNSAIIMFSTDPDIRHLYGINGLQPSDSLSEKYNVVPHTWDSELLVENMVSRCGEKKPRYPNPISSTLDELPNRGTIPATEYCTLENLDELDRLVNELPDDVDFSLKKKIEQYIRDLKRSPLWISGDYRESEVFKRSDMTYDYLMSILYETGDEGHYQNTIEVLSEIYGQDLNRNPVLDEIIERISRIIGDESKIVTLVVHAYDVKGTKKLLQKKLDENMLRRVSVCPWSGLSEKEREIPDGYEHYVISTLPPSLAYKIYYSKIRKFLFIGSGKNVDKIRTIIEKRLADTISRPIFHLETNDPSPELLKDIFSSVEMPSNAVLQEIAVDITVDFEEGVGGHHQSYSSPSGGSHPSIKPKNHAVLVIDIDGNSMFIPYGSSVFIRENNKPAEISVESGGRVKSGLKNKEIIIDRNNLYVSFKSIFMRFMVANGERVTFRRGPYKWDGFLELYCDAISWINTLKKVISLIENAPPATGELAGMDAGQILSLYLSRLDLGANNPEHIKGWWSNYEIVSTDRGDFPVYDIEHPRSRDDIRKIYESINKDWPEMNLDLDEAERSYIAAITIQKFRRSFLKGNKKDVDPALSLLHHKLEKEITRIIDSAQVFKVKDVSDVEITREVDPFKIMSYSECLAYIKTS